MKRVYTCERQDSTDLPFGRSPILKIRRTGEGDNTCDIKYQLPSINDETVKKTSSGDLETLLWYYYDQTEKRDPQNFFARPVTDNIAPGYSKIIRQPIDLGTIKQRIKRKYYRSIHEYQADTRLMCHNAMTYNTPDTIYYQKARRILAYIDKSITPLRAQTLAKELGLILSNRHLGFEDTTDDEDEGDEDDAITVEDEALDRGGSETTDGGTDYSSGPPRLSPIADSISYDQPQEEDVDAETAECIVSQVKEAAEQAQERLKRRYGNRGIPKLGYLSIGRPVSSENVFVHEIGSEASSEPRLVKLSAMDEVELFLGNGSVPPWTGETLWKSVEALGANPKEAVAPHLDWVLKGFSEDTSRQLISAYGDSLAVEYAYSLLTFASECGIFPRTLAHKCLNILTEGEHDKVHHLWQRRIPNGVINIADIHQTFQQTVPSTNSSTLETSTEKTAPLPVAVPPRQTATVQPFTRSDRM